MRIPREYSARDVAAEGHDPGHPAGLTWGELVRAWRDELGGWTPLAEELMRRAGPKNVEMPRDLGSIERGLRRLAERGQKDGGQYGRWLDRFFGVPPAIESWVRWLGQYHRRFADFPVSLCRQQLALWDRPPIQGSALGAWIDLGVASVAMRTGDRETVLARLAIAQNRVERAGDAAFLEHRLFSARALEGDDRAVDRLLDEARARLDAKDLETDDRACYLARYLDARAYRVLHEPILDIARARDIYESIPADTGLPFVDFRRAIGRAYCAYRSGESEVAVALALDAADCAADGGFVRLRVMGLNLASRASTDRERSDALRDRALRLSRMLEDEDLLARVEKKRSST